MTGRDWKQWKNLYVPRELGEKLDKIKLVENEAYYRVVARLLVIYKQYKKELKAKTKK